MMKCNKECENFCKTVTETKGICSLQENYFLVDINADCVFMQDMKEKKTCKDCDRFRTDYACLTADENDSADDCFMFISKLDIEFNNLMFKYFKQNNYSRKHISKLLDDFENNAVIKFLNKQKEVKKNETR